MKYLGIRKSGSVSTLLLLGTLLSAAVQGASWPMKQRDMCHTGRADFVVPDTRLNGTFFNYPAWQTPSPGSPGEGSLGAASMSYFDGAGPEGADIVIGAYHWPKGVQGMDRHTGAVFWYGNPDGGESIAERTPAFSPDGQTIYVVNDATSGPLMAFETTTGPWPYRSNSGDSFPDHFEKGSPTIGPDGSIFNFAWDDRPYGALDEDGYLYEFFAAQTGVNSCYNEPSLYQYDNETLLVYGTGRGHYIRCWDAMGGYQWYECYTAVETDATITIDPANGNLYVAAGSNDIYVIGLDKDLNPLWSESKILVFDYVAGENQPQRAQSAGCLSHDGATYYFQTVGSMGTGCLYAINTADGTTKWAFPTQSKGWENHSSCPIITSNNVIVVGNNDSSTYYAILDNGQDDYTVLDTLQMAEGGNARSSATISPDGLLYLPGRTTWLVGNGGGKIPDYTVQNLFNAFNLTENTELTLYPPGGQHVEAGNQKVAVNWTPIPDPGEVFGHYAIYRDTEAFTSVAGKNPVAIIPNVNAGQCIDGTAVNGISYYYAVTVVSGGGAEITTIDSVGPATPFYELDMQFVTISRFPKFPRYCPTYTDRFISDPNGFGPYGFSSATGLDCGQNDETQHTPSPGQTMTYTATFRNRGSVVVDQAFDLVWSVDGQEARRQTINRAIQPGQTITDNFQLAWDDNFHDISAAIELEDDRTENNQFTSNTLAVGFLTYIDRSFYNQFRELWSLQYPDRQTDDLIDWLNNHMRRFNEMFETAGCDKRVHYDVLEFLGDTDLDPAVDTIYWAIFPFRYHKLDNDPRTSGYYRFADDIDYGLLHEMGHQLGMIDLYQLDAPSEWNEVSGMGYNGPDGLMRGCSDFISEHSAHAMNLWLHQAHGYYGQYLYRLPRVIQLRILDYQGKPLPDATVRMYQYCERPDIGKRITNQIKAQGITDSEGLFMLPNVAIDPTKVPPIGTGDVLNDNPFGYVAVVGTNGVLHFAVEYNGRIDYCWLDITEANNAYFNGQVDLAVFDRQLTLGGSLIKHMPRQLAEWNAEDWDAWAEGSTPENTWIENDFSRKVFGFSSLKFTTDGAFDTYIRYPKSYTASWDLSGDIGMSVYFYAENENGFQNGSPWIRLRDANGNFAQYQYYRDGSLYEILNDVRGRWQSTYFSMNSPSDTQNGWRRTDFGQPDMSAIQSIEIHVDTWGDSFKLWVDGLQFYLPDQAFFDLSDDGLVDINDLMIFSQYWLEENVSWPDCRGADQNQDHRIDFHDMLFTQQLWLTE